LGKQNIVVFLQLKEKESGAKEGPVLLVNRIGLKVRADTGR